MSRGKDIKQLTIKNLPPDLAEALEQERRRRGQSLDQTVIDLLSQELGIRGTHSNGLIHLADGWSEEEFREFERAAVPFEEVDEELWS
jgi:kynureninase